MLRDLVSSELLKLYELLCSVEVYSLNGILLKASSSLLVTSGYGTQLSKFLHEARSKPTRIPNSYAGTRKQKTCSGARNTEGLYVLVWKATRKHGRIQNTGERTRSAAEAGRGILCGHGCNTAATSASAVEKNHA